MRREIFWGGLSHPLCLRCGRGSQFRGNIEDTENVYQETSILEVAEILEILLTRSKFFLRVIK